VRGGAADASIHRKFTQAEQMASELRLPLIRMIDGTGGGGSVKMLEQMGFTYVPFVPGWEHVVKNLDTVPVVGLALGPTAGLGAARVVASHYSVMVKGLSQMFTAGPAVVAALGEDQDKESLGGSHIHTRAYNMRKILEAVVDKGSLFEMGRRWGRAAITGFARFDGWPVAILAGDPTYLGGSWTADTAQKAKRFLGLAEKFGLPVIHFVDNPGFMIGLEAERTATIRHGVEAMTDIYKSKTPWASVIIRKAYGVAGAAMSNHSRFQYRFAWPSGDWGSLPIEGGVEVAYSAELEASDNPSEKLAEIKSRLAKVTSPFRTAEKFAIEDIIDPRETRVRLCEFVNLVMR